MKHATKFHPAALACAVLLAGHATLAAQSAVPDEMTYQAYVTDNNNDPLAPNNPANFVTTFRIYDTATGNNVIWAEQQTVTIFQGNFSVLLGNGQLAGAPHDALSDVFSGAARYMGITVGANPEFTPRQRILPNAYAYRAKVAESVGGVLSLNGTTANLTNNMTVGGNVGIGTTNPFTPLHIAGSGSQEFSLESTEPAGRRWTLQSNANGMLEIIDRDAGVSRLAVSTNGNVGIGTTNPVSKLHVNTQNDASLTGHGGLVIGAINSTNMVFDSNEIQARSNGAASPLILQFDGSNVGIGTSSPARKLHVAGGAFLKAPGSSGAVDPNGGLRLEEDDNTTAWSAFYDTSNDNLAFRYSNNSVDALVMESGGNVGIGTSNPAKKLDVNGDVRGSLIVRPSGSYENGSIYSDGNWGMLFRSAQTSPVRATFAFATSSDTKLLTMEQNGAIGIGTETAGSRGKLEVHGALGNTNLNGFGILSLTQSFTTTQVNTSGVTSIYGSGRMTANSFVAFSDERIKNVKGMSDGAADLGTLRDIKITDYTYIDTVAKGNGTQKKVIAQQVKDVFPQAVSITTDEVPDIYQKAAIADGWVTLATDLKVGERVRLVGEKEDAIHEVLELRKGGFRTAFKPPAGDVFVYGREVEDFHNVDYEAIAMLNVSATQELARQLETKDAEIASLKKQLSEQAERLAGQEALDARLTKLEALMSKGATVSN